MLQKNNGSILIMTLMVFTIVSIICVSCASLILSNSRINKLDYENEVLKQGNLGVIEIVKSNILQEVNNAIENTKTEDEFYEYFTTNNVISKIGDISLSNISDAEVTITNDSTLSNKEVIRYKILTKNKINNYDKYIRVSVKITNPWYKDIKEVDNVEENNMDEFLLDDELNNNTLEYSESDLVIFYNYEEI